jgi:mutator protein MutT
VALAGFWEFPGGKILANEVPAEAAIRECREETGLEVGVVGTLDERNYDYKHGPVHLQFFACQPVLPVRTPREPFRWVKREDLIHYRFPPANEELLAQLRSRGA